jgi:hypothetical protein
MLMEAGAYYYERNWIYWHPGYPFAHTVFDCGEIFALYTDVSCSQHRETLTFLGGYPM